MSLVANRNQPPPMLRNALANWAAFLFAIGVNFFLSPFVVHSLGNTVYGIWILLASVTGYMGLLDFGVRSAVTRYVARYHAVGQDEDASRIASTALMVFSIIGLVVVLASVVVALFVIERLKIPPSMIGIAQTVTLISGIAMAATIVSGVFGGVVTAMQRFDLISGAQIAIGAARAVTVVIVLSSGGGLVPLALIQLGQSLLQALISYGLARRLYPELRASLRGWSAVELRRIISFSVFSSLLRFSSTIILSTDSVVIGAFLSASAITIFSLASMLCMYGESVISAIAQLVGPRASALDAADGRGAVGPMVLRAGRAATLVILPITITFVLRGARFIDLWMGPEYGPLSGPLLRPLAIALTFVAASHINGSALMGLNRHREVVPFALAEAALNLALSIYWIGTMGLLGVALGTAIPRLARTLIVMPWLLRRHAGVNYSETWREVWIRPLLAAAPFGVATWMIEEWWPAHHLATYFAQIAAILPLMAVGTWFVALSAEDRRRLHVAVSRHVPWAVSKA